MAKAVGGPRLRRIVRPAAAAAQAAEEQRRLDEAAASFGNVFYFDFDSSNLRPEAIDALNAHIATLQGNDRNVRLEGHTDERGTREYNMALGERRANAVRGSRPQFDGARPRAGLFYLCLFLCRASSIDDVF